jgi:hypothetical protein
MKILSTLALASAFLAGGVQASDVTAKSTAVCLGDKHCAGRGLLMAKSEDYFGLQGKRVLKTDDHLTYSCLTLGQVYVLSTYSKQVRPEFQPVQLDISSRQQADCVAPRVVTRNLKDLPKPVAIGAQEYEVTTAIGQPTETWMGPNSAHEIASGDHALVYRGSASTDFTLVVISGGRVTRLVGSIAP